MDERSERFAKRFELPILVAAVLVIPVIVIEESSVGEPWRMLAGILNWVIWVAFAIELVVMLSVVPSKGRWLRQHPLELIVVILTPPFLPASLQGIRVLRLLRLLRLLRVAQLGRRVFSLEGVRYAALLALMTAVGGGAAFAATEKNVTTFDGIWWAVSTMTTVGYGDVYPHTAEGKLIAMGVMVVGIGFVALLTAALAERFLAHEVQEIVEAEADIEATESELLREIQEITGRLRQLEASVQRLGRSRA